MNLGQRLFYYLGGFTMGLIILFFFLGGKKTSCDYSPTARVLKNIRIKKKEYSTQAIATMNTFTIDTSQISQLLIDGKVNFSKSNTKLDSCKLYHIEGIVNDQALVVLIQNCDSIAKISSMTVSE